METMTTQGLLCHDGRRVGAVGAQERHLTRGSVLEAWGWTEKDPCGKEGFVKCPNAPPPLVNNVDSRSPKCECLWCGGPECGF